MSFEILMATMNRNLIEDIDWDYKNCGDSSVLLINQSNFIGDTTSGNVRMISTTERGSSKSRNTALAETKATHAIFADDDVAYVDNMEEIVMGYFKEYPSADIITFQIATPDGGKFNPGYREQACWHNWRTLLKCASIEIAFKPESIRGAGILLDEKFGLGSKYRVHDEVIFLKDALSAGLNILYVPVPIVIHPAESSGTNFTRELIYSKGAAFVRLFGPKGMVFNLLFSLIKYPIYKHQIGFWSFLGNMFRGSFGFLREDAR
ncbi:glycosyltransferase [Stutzerimonas stutzeri]|uniref:glycosyltransferase n=1 Tax=Stutzerimonas stutzeri TaxID=316 RepID=UPI0021FE51C7|nr:glycosyltransferase [Stutzerimonas stutzeri]UVO19527.1 glycosyltransferase [Stutzerimonas stutzeri]